MAAPNPPDRRETIVHLADHVFVAEIDDRAVILDLAADLYLGLDIPLSQGLRAILAGEDDDLDPAYLDRARKTLIARGVLSSQAARTVRRQAPQVEAALWPSLDDPTSPLPLQISALSALTAASNSLRHRSIADTAAWLARAKRRRLGRPRRSPETLLTAYRKARPWFPEKPVCRLDALGLVLFLNRHGHPADLVFGARLEPFQAHCWAQLGAVALNEAPDGLRQYAPIMTV